MQTTGLDREMDLRMLSTFVYPEAFLYSIYGDMYYVTVWRLHRRRCIDSMILMPAAYKCTACL